MNTQKTRFRKEPVRAATPFADARDELFQQIMRCGVVGSAPEDQKDWFDNTMDYLAGRYALPSPGALRADIERERRAMFKRYVASKRHTMQVDFDDCARYGLPPDELVGDDYTRTQTFADAIRDRGATAMIVPSAALPGQHGALTADELLVPLLQVR